VRVRRVVIGLVAGLIVGSILGAWPGDVASRVVAFFNPIGQVWVNSIRMTIVPLVVSLLFVSVASRETSEGLGKIGITTLLTFLGLLVFAAIVSLLLVPPLMNDMKLAPDAAAALRNTASAGAKGTASQVAQLPGFAAWITGLVPANVIKAAADGAMLPLIVFAFVFALASRHVEASLRKALIDFFGAIAGAMTKLVEWIIALAPIGVFALVLVAASRVGIALAGAMAYYIVAISAVLVLFALLMYPVASIGGRLHLNAFTRAALPAQAVALSSSSSLASLPALVEGSRRLGLSPQVSGFVLPLAVSTFKVATPISWLVGITFLARLYGVALPTSSLVAIAFTAVALSLTLPGVPQGAVLLIAPMLATYGIPAEGVALLIAADTIPDLFGTMTNVTGDLVAGCVVGRKAVAEPVPEVASSVNA
jgi:proton glutamate symport protein